MGEDGAHTEDVNTPVGAARVTLAGDGPLCVLGHGAGGGTGAADLLAARAAGLDAGLTVALVEQPWLVSGGRVAPAPARLDTAWLAVLTHLAARHGPPLVAGGRSSGARVACRTAAATGAQSLLCLAFPLTPPWRPDASRRPELALPDVPRLVVQGDRDPFGMPLAAPGLLVHVVRGADHAFDVRRKDGRSRADVLAEVRAAVEAWLRGRLTG